MVGGLRSLVSTHQAVNVLELAAALCLNIKICEHIIYMESKECAITAVPTEKWFMLLRNYGLAFNSTFLKLRRTILVLSGVINAWAHKSWWMHKLLFIMNGMDNNHYFLHFLCAFLCLRPTDPLLRLGSESGSSRLQFTASFSIPPFLNWETNNFNVV